MVNVVDLVVRSFGKALLNLAVFPRGDSYFRVGYRGHGYATVLGTFTDKNSRALTYRFYYSPSWVGEGIAEEDSGKTIREILERMSIRSKPALVPPVEFSMKLPEINILIAMEWSPYEEKETNVLMNEIKEAFMKELETKVL